MVGWGGAAVETEKIDFVSDFKKERPAGPCSLNLNPYMRQTLSPKCWMPEPQVSRKARSHKSVDPSSRKPSTHQSPIPPKHPSIIPQSLEKNDRYGPEGESRTGAASSQGPAGEGFCRGSFRGLEEFERGLGCRVQGLAVRSVSGLQCFGAGGLWGFGG